MNTKGNVSVMLQALAALILTGVLILGGCNIIADHFGPHTHYNDIYLSSITNKVRDALAADPGNFSEFALNLFKEESFYFFSSGTGPITLAYTGSDTQHNGNLIFSRPNDSACNDAACVCYCAGGPYWIPSETEPYVVADKLFINQEYSCPVATCETVSDTNNKVYFGNARGMNKDIYVDSETALFSRGKNEAPSTVKRKLYPVSFNVPLLLQSSFFKGDFKKPPWYEITQDYGNLFFQESANFQNKLSRSEVNFLLENYSWSGGVVIGGMGYAQTDSDANNKELHSPTPLIMRFETTTDPSIIGVCIQDKCLEEKSKTTLEEYKSHAQVDDVIIQPFEKLTFNMKYDFLSCFRQQTNDALERSSCLFTTQFYYLNPLLEQFRIREEKISSLELPTAARFVLEVKPEQKRSDPDFTYEGTTFNLLRVSDPKDVTVEQSFTLPIYFPQFFDKEKINVSDLTGKAFNITGQFEDDDSIQINYDTTTKYDINVLTINLTDNTEVYTLRFVKVK